MTSFDPIAEIRITLQGPVMHILSGLVPELAGLEPPAAYERVMDDLGLLERCFAAFRANPEAFAPLLVDTTGKPVGADGEIPLACGRSLDQVMGMVVRSAARRYFRRRLPQLISAGRRAAAAERRGLVSDLMGSFRGEPAAASARPLSQGEALYREISDYLRFDWQVRLVPSYSRLSLTQVRVLGDSLLEIRDEHMLKAALSGRPMPAPQQSEATPATVAATPAVPEAPPAFDPAAVSEQDLFLARLIDGDGQVRIKLLAEALGGPHARAALAANPLRQNATIPPDIGAGAVAVMVKLMDLREEQIAVALVSAYAMLGRSGFPAVFGIGARPATMRQLVERARAAGIGRYTPPMDVAEFFEKAFARAREKLFKAA